MNRVKKKSIGDKLGVIYAVLLFAFIYIPTVIMVVYSFNQQPSNKWWTGFTTEWYGKLFRDAQLWQSFSLSLKISLLSTLIVVIIGGMGSLGGAAIGALALGLVDAYADVYLVIGGTDLTNYSILVTFALLVGVLAVRPLGLFGRPA